MRNKRQKGLALMLVTLMVLSIFALLPAASAAPGYSWRDYEYPIQPKFGTALRYKMYTVDLMNSQLPALKYYSELGVFSSEFLVSYQKMIEFLYRSCDPDLWWFQDEMYVYTTLYGNYPGDSNKPIPQSASSQATKIFQDEFIVIVELNNQIRKLTDDYEQATGMNKLLINSMLMTMKQIRNTLVLSDMAIAYRILDMANACVDAIENSNGVVDLSAVGGPSDYELENQQQILKWSDSANGYFDDGVSGLNLDVTFVRTKLELNQQNLIVISSGLDSSAYTNAMRLFEKTLIKAGHALAMSGGMEYCMNTILLMIPAAVGIVLCAGVAVQKRRMK